VLNIASRNASNFVFMVFFLENGYWYGFTRS
jgi:hypothetical protein